LGCVDSHMGLETRDSAVGGKDLVGVDGNMLLDSRVSAIVQADS
jgi:hypothetical protein